MPWQQGLREGRREGCLCSKKGKFRNAPKRGIATCPAYSRNPKDRGFMSTLSTVAAVPLLRCSALPRQETISSKIGQHENNPLDEEAAGALDAIDLNGLTMGNKKTGSFPAGTGALALFSTLH